MNPNERRLFATKCNASVYAAAGATSTLKSGQNVSRPVITRGNIGNEGNLLRKNPDMENYRGKRVWPLIWGGGGGI